MNKVDQIQPLVAAEQQLLNGGYTGIYAKIPTTGARLYLTGFSAATKLHQVGERAF